MALFKKHDPHKSILAGQKLKKRRPSLRFLKYGFLVAFLSGAFGVSYFLNLKNSQNDRQQGLSKLSSMFSPALSIKEQQNLSEAQQEQQAWLFRYASLSEEESEKEGFGSITAADKDRIEALAKTTLKDNSQASLHAFGEAILSGSPYNKIHLYAYEPTSLMISLGKHKPLFAVYADTWRYVSTEGSVYGEVEDTTLPKLHGVFSERTQAFTFKRQNELELSEAEAAIIQEALALHQAAIQENFLITAINFKKYRGFFVTLADSGTVISLGKAPFNGKIKKLRKILYLLATKGQQAASIELDFEDKAFIKEYSF